MEPDLNKYGVHASENGRIVPQPFAKKRKRFLVISKRGWEYTKAFSTRRAAQDYLDAMGDKPKEIF